MSEEYIFVGTDKPELVIFSLDSDPVKEVQSIALSSNHNFAEEIVIYDETHCICV